MTKWKKIRYIKIPWEATDDEAVWKYELLLPEPLASWDVFSKWERERTESLEKNLKKDDILFDVGAEHGWLSALLGKFCNVFLIEPTKEFWPNIRQTWEKNLETKPAGYFSGLVGDKGDKKKLNYSEWPTESNGELIEKLKYVYIHDNSENVPVKTIDQIVKESNVIPTALNIDVEGAEMLVINGAANTLKRYKPLVWVSIHGDLIKGYNSSEEKLVKKMESLGYVGELLATDHEKHYFFK